MYEWFESTRNRTIGIKNSARNTGKEEASFFPFSLKNNEDKQLHETDDFGEKYPCIMAAIGGIFPVVIRLHPRADDDGAEID